MRKYGSPEPVQADDGDEQGIHTTASAGWDDSDEQQLSEEIPEIQPAGEADTR